MSGKTLRAPARGRLTLGVKAGALILDVTASRQVTTATAELAGPEKIISNVSSRKEGGAWVISLPDTVYRGVTVFSGRRHVSSVISGGNFGSTVIQSGGPIIMGGGRVVVNGVDVTDMVNGPDAGPVKLTVRLPAGSSLDVDVRAGSIRCCGPLDSVTAETAAADVEVEQAGGLDAHSSSGDIRVGRLAGPAQVSASSGDIVIHEAAGAVTANASSGDITIHCTAAVSVSARTSSGDVRVTAVHGVVPRVRARSSSGRVTQPGGNR